MNIYAYIPREDGSAPLGTANRVIMKDAKRTLRQLIKLCWKRLGTHEIIVWTFTNFYDSDTFTLQFNGTKHKNIPKP